MASLIATRRQNPAKQARGRRVVLWLFGLYLVVQALVGYVIDHHGLAIRFHTASIVLHDVEVGPSKRPRLRRRILPKNGRTDASRDLSSRHGFAVHCKELGLNTEWMAGGVNRHPQRGRFDQLPSAH